MLIQFLQGAGMFDGASPTSSPTPTPTPTPMPTSPVFNFVDPDGAVVVLAPGTTPSTSPARLAIVQGAAQDFCLQCRNRGGAPAAFAAGDTITAAIYQWRVAAPICTPAVAWYTAGDDQTGYDQGQIVVSPTNDDAALLQPTGGPLGYTLVVTWTPAAEPSKSAPIVRLPLAVETEY